MYLKERDKISNGEWTLFKAENFSIFQSFDCGDKDLNEFIHDDAEKHRNELLAETYYLIEATVKDDFPVAFISFCNDSIQLSKQ